jgi:hypothetical protein
MRHLRTRVALAIVGAGGIAYLLGCASAQRDPSYDDSLEFAAGALDNATLIPITIQNDRSRDIADPTFFIVANGRHSLGIVQSLSSRRIFVDSRWLVAADGCMRIVAHYVGGGDLTYNLVCWRPGEVIDVTLSTLFNPVAAWSHR